jgi:rhomboid-like protein
MNGLTFFFMAPIVLGTLGNAGFLTLYLGGGIASSLVSVAWNRYISHRSTGSHGASGAFCI